MNVRQADHKARGTLREACLPDVVYGLVYRELGPFEGPILSDLTSNRKKCGHFRNYNPKIFVEGIVIIVSGIVIIMVAISIVIVHGNGNICDSLCA